MNKKSVSRIIALTLVVFLLLDTGYTFYQHATKSLDGDLVAIVLPSEYYQTVLSDPFGIQVIADHKTYAAPNRFFIHWYLTHYFKTVPQLLQNLVTPVESLYYAAALSKTLIHIFLITLLAYMVSGTKRFFSRQWLVAAAILSPLFQSGGHFYKYIGIVDQSITYSSFYALPMVFLLLFLIPYFRFFSTEEVELKNWQIGGMALLVLMLPFSGPLIPGIILVLAFLWGSSFLWKIDYSQPFNKIKESSLPLFLIFIALTLLSLYSVYIGKYNIENNHAVSMSLWERYQKLPIGLYYQLTQKLGFPLLLLMILINTFLIKRYAIKKEQALRLLKWIGIFTLIYLLLLPLGGSREYRPYILRKDTMLPIILALVFYYGQSTFWLLQQNFFKYRKVYFVIVLLFSLIFTIADEPDADQHLCERNALIEIAKSPDDVVRLNSDCTVLSWGLITDPESSKNHAELFQIWNITEGQKQFYQGEN